MLKTFDFISDPGHGWVKVPFTMLHDLGIADKITDYSYKRDTYAYLEEDCDATTFHKAYVERFGFPPKYRERNAGQRYSRVRGYHHYVSGGAKTYNSQRPDPQILGVTLSTKCGFDGTLIFLACLAALEDANFHKVSRALIETWEKVEGPLPE